MKKILAIVVLTASMIQVSSAAASDPVEASIGTDFVIQLPVNVALSDSYIVDISALPFDNAAEAETFFDMFSENAVNYKILPGDSRMILSLNRDIMPEWDLADWNKYFKDRAVKMQVVFNENFK